MPLVALRLQQRGPTFLWPWYSTAGKMKLNKLCVKIEIRLVECMTVGQACKAIKKRINNRESVSALQMSQSHTYIYIYILYSKRLQRPESGMVTVSWCASTQGALNPPKEEHFMFFL